MSSLLLTDDLHPGMGATHRFMHGITRKTPTERHDPKLTAAILEARVALRGGNWHPKPVVSAIAKNRGVTLSVLIDRGGIALSQSSSYVCLVQTDSPECAPDER